MPKSSLVKRGNKREIVFDPEARKAHLRGFSERKRQRRTYGLAMQKVKDRQAKLEQRKKEREDRLHQVEEAEQQKGELLEEHYRMINNIRDDDEDEESEEEADDEKEEQKDDQRRQSELSSKTYEDDGTKQMWGGNVKVTTSAIEMGRLSSDDEVESSHNRKATDKQQKYAGNVEKYMKALKGNMPGKHRGHRAKRKGKNGASEMKGMGGAGHLKIAQKALTRSLKNKKPTKGVSGGHKKRGGKVR